MTKHKKASTAGSRSQAKPLPKAAPPLSPSLTLSRSWGWLLAGILFACAIVYFQTLHFGYAYDDPLQITDNPLIRSLSPDNISRIFSSTVAAMYQPLTTLLYAVEYSLWQLNPAGYHAVNILFHLLNIALLFSLVTLVVNDRRIGLLTALLFGLHPLNAETVSWLSCLSSLLYTSLVLLSLMCYVKYCRMTGTRRLRLFAASMLLFAAALLAKSAAMALPVLLFAFDYFLKRRWRMSLLWEKAPYFALALIAALAAVKIRGSGGYIGDLSHIFSPVDRLFMVCYSFGFYPFKALVPFGFSAYYPYPVKTGGALPMIFYLAPLLIAGAGFGMYRLVKDRRYFIFTALLYAVPIALSLQFVPVGKQITADRYAYLPCIGVYLIAAYLIVKYRRFRALPYGVAPIFAAILATVTVMQSAIWRSDVTLWTDVIKKAPDSDMGYLNRGMALASGAQKDYRTALSDLTLAITRRSPFSNTEMAYNNRANIFKAVGNFPAALADYDSALLYSPRFLTGLKNRAELRRQMGMTSGALDDFNAALRLAPRDIDLLAGKGLTDLMAEDFTAARRDFTDALALDRGSYAALNGRGIANDRLGDYTAAAGDFDCALRIDPHSPDAYTNRAMMENDSGNYGAAIADCNQALALDPRDLQALVGRSIAERNRKNFTAALTDLFAAHAIDTTFLPVFYERGVTCYEAGRYAEAAAVFTAVISRNPGYRDAWYYAGLTFKKLNDDRQAKMCMQRAAQLGKKEALQFAREMK